MSGVALGDAEDAGLGVGFGVGVGDAYCEMNLVGVGDGGAGLMIFSTLERNGFGPVEPGDGEGKGVGVARVSTALAAAMRTAAVRTTRFIEGCMGVYQSQQRLSLP